MSRAGRGRLALRGALMAVLVLGATACSVSSSDDDDKSAESTTTTKADAPKTTVPVRGVTDDSIKLGMAIIDIAGVKEQFGVDLGNLPDGSIEALIDATNQAGGINGRQVEVVQRPFIPVGTEDSEAACRELIEDHEVYAVVGMFLGDAGLCVTETYSTPYIAAFGLNDERQERSKAPFLSIEGSVGDTLASAVDIFAEEGVLDDAKVAVYHESSESADLVQEFVVKPLEDAGVDVVSTAELPASGDPVQAASDIDLIFQRFQADGADTLLNVSGAAVILPALERTTWEPQLLFTNGQFTSGDALDGYGLTDPSELDGALAASLSIASEELVDDEELIECLDTINAGIGTDYTTEDIFPKEVRPDSQEIGQLVGVCQLWDFTVTILEAAGDDLSPDGLLAGLDELDDFSLAGRPDVSLSSEKWGAAAEMRLWPWNPEAQRFEPEALQAG